MTNVESEDDIGSSEAILETKSPMDTGLCTYQDLEKALNRAKNKKDKAEAEAAKSESEVN